MASSRPISTARSALCREIRSVTESIRTEMPVTPRPTASSSQKSLFVPCVARMTTAGTRLNTEATMPASTFSSITRKICGLRLNSIQEQNGARYTSGISTTNAPAR